MKHLTIDGLVGAAAGVVLVALGACSTLGIGGGGTCDTLCAAKKADGSAHDAHTAAALALSAGAASGILHGTAASTAKSYLDQSYGWLQKADLAISAGDAASATSDLAQAAPLTANAQVLATVGH